MVPNIVHFIHFTGEKSRPFNYLNYLAVRAAVYVQSPAYVFVYCNEEPENNPHWQKMKQLPQVLVVLMDAPVEFEGVSLQGYPQYQADVVRLQRLKKMGGIYLDTDAIVIKKMNDLFTSTCAMSAVAVESELAFGNSTIIAQKQSKFINTWLERLSEGLRSGVWAWHGSNLPALIAKEMPDEITVLKQEAFLPYNFTDNCYLKDTHEDDVNKCLDKCKDSYVVHLWETYYPNIQTMVTEEYVANEQTPLARILRAIP